MSSLLTEILTTLSTDDSDEAAYVRVLISDHIDTQIAQPRQGPAHVNVFADFDGTEVSAARVALALRAANIDVLSVDVNEGDDVWAHPSILVKED